MGGGLFDAGARRQSTRSARRPGMGRWRRIGVVLLGLAASSGCHSFRARPIDYQSSMARELTCCGMDALQRGKSEDAEALLARAAAAAPRDQRVRAEWSKALANRGQLGRAIEQMQIATELSPNDERYHIELGRLFLQTAQIDRALAEGNAAIELNRSAADAWALRGRANRALGKLDPAKADLHRAAALQPELLDVRFELAEIHLRQNQPERSLAILEGILRDGRSEDLPAELPLLRGQALADVGELDLAAETLVAAIERGQIDRRLYLALYQIQTLRGDQANALLTLQRGRSVFPEDPSFRLAEAQPVSGTSDLPADAASRF